MSNAQGPTADPDSLHPDLVKRLDYLSLLLQLPDGGVRIAWPDEEACQDRIIRIRWPEGVVCPACGGQSINTLPKRNLFQCRGCRKQFTPTSGTALHRSRLPIQMWLIATQAIIRSQAYDPAHGGISLKDLGRILGIHTEAAARVRRTVMLDIDAKGQGLLRRAVCFKALELPATVVPGSYQHLMWVDAQTGHRFGPALT